MLLTLFLRGKRGDKKKSNRLENHAGKKLAERILRIQLGVLLLTATVAMVGFGWEYGLGAAWGSLCACIPFLIFARLAFVMTGARMAQLTVRAFYLGEALKLISGLILLVIGLAILRLKAEPLLISYVLTQVPVWLGPLFLKTTKK